MESLFKNLIWPAIAGNVAWSFFTVAIAEPWTSSVLPRLSTLVLIALYLMAAWMRNRTAQSKAGYFWLDGLFGVAIAVLAISTSAPATAVSSTATWALIAVFAVSAAGHALGVWDVNRPRCQRYALTAANIFGIAVVAIGAYLEPLLLLWGRVAAIGLVLVVLARLWSFTPVAPSGHVGQQ